MKTHVSPHTVALLFLSSITPLSAQNLTCALRTSEVSVKADNFDEGSESRFGDINNLVGKYDLPAAKKAQSEISKGKPVYAAQDALTLNTQSATPRNIESIVDLNILREPSSYRKVAVSAGGTSYKISADSLQTGLALISAVYRETGKAEKVSDCHALSLSVEQRIQLDSAKVLEVVESELASNPSCACEVVKTAIKASEADVKMVVSIVETAITTSPENMRIISQCAIAAMPESITEVQALLAKLDPNSGDEGDSSKSAKSAKGGEVASITAPPLPNPLDLPPFPPFYPPTIIPPPITTVNFGEH